MKLMTEFQREMDRTIAAAQRRHAESVEDLARLFEWREWFGFRPGWPARRAQRVAAKETR